MPYPVSDHCDGTRFFNPEPSNRMTRGGTGRLIRSRLQRGPDGWSAWPKAVPNTAHPPPGPDDTSATWIGHSTFLLRLPGLNILTDPVFSARCSPTKLAGPRRVRAPGMAIEALPRIDLILLSHNHYDHMDIPALRRIRAHFPAAQIVTLLGNAPFLNKKRLPGAIELDWWQHVTLHGALITATPARHFSARTLWDRNETLWGGFHINHRGQRLYFAGDTGYTRYFGEIRHRLGAPDLALLPIGAYEPRWFMAPVHMDPQDAVRAFLDLQARRAIAMHFGTFQLTAEAIDAPLHALAGAMAKAGIGQEDFMVLQTGESFVF